MQTIGSETTTAPTADARPAHVGAGGDSAPGERPPSASRTRGRIRRAVRALAVLLTLAGVLLLADGATTLLWQEPVSSLYGRWQQDKLAQQLTDLEQAPATTTERRAAARIADPGRRLAFSARAFARHVHVAGPLGRLRIPRIGVSAVVVEGTGAGELRKGPGHYPATSLPGQRRTVAIAGHRTTFGAWFRHIDRLRPSDPIELVLPYGRFTYRVQLTRVVPSTARWITKSVGYDRLVLSACHPLFSASKRIVVFARLVTARLTTYGPSPPQPPRSTHLEGGQFSSGATGSLFKQP